MSLDLTDDIKSWLALIPDQRDQRKGAELLLKVNRNKILFDNALRNPQKFMPIVEYELKKILAARLDLATKQQAKTLVAKAEEIADQRGLPSAKKPAQFRAGKRSDHDLLPDCIKKLYEDNDQIRLKMRECHLRIRLVNDSNSSCPDSDRYPWAKELIRLDSIYRRNWYEYDHFVRDGQAPQLPEDSPKDKHLKALRLLNLNFKRLEASNSPELRAKMAQWVKDLAFIPEHMLAKINALGLL